MRHIHDSVPNRWIVDTPKMVISKIMIYINQKKILMLAGPPKKQNIWNNKLWATRIGAIFFIFKSNPAHSE